MLFISIIGIIGIVGIIITISAKIHQKRNILLVGIFTLLVMMIFSIIFIIYVIESQQEELENSIEAVQNDLVPIPDRIVYKNCKNEYFLIDKKIIIL